MNGRILVVDDEPSMREYLELLLTRAGHRVHTAGTQGEAEALLAGADVVITDFRLGKESGLEVLRRARSLPGGPEVIIITAYGTPASAVQAMREGAYDYIAKPFDNDELKLLVQRALEKRGLAQENERLREKLIPGAAPLFVGTSAAMHAVWGVVKKVAATPKTTVLISGESGVGKEVVARAIHFQSARAAEPFVPVNCGAIPEGLLESELFGHVKGSFTGATSDRQGILVSAGGGTVLLDEVGELPLATQVKLLRVLQERRVKPVGSSKEVAFEARVLAATNRNLEEDVKSGRFREDLWFRLNVVSLEIPPLRDRREDVGPMARAFLSRAAEELGRPGLRFTDEALEVLARARLPGNVRQLQNIVERASALADGDVLGVESLPAAVRGMPEPGVAAEVAFSEGFSLEAYLDGLERKYLEEGLRRAGGVKTKAAQVLGLSFRSFRYRLAKFGMN